jgi:hypothetical protein
MNSHIASSYVAVVVEILGAAQSIEASSSSSVAVAVFDTALENLKMPLVTPFSLPRDLQQTPLGEGEEEELPEELFPDIGTVEVASVVEKYFQWSGVVKRGELIMDVVVRYARLVLFFLHQVRIEMAFRKMMQGTNSRYALCVYGKSTTCQEIHPPKCHGNGGRRRMWRPLAKGLPLHS